LLAALQALIVQIDALTDQLIEQLHAHADAHIFRSLPRTQALRAARLLAEIGDARGRFPTPEALGSLAGVSPSTRQSVANFETPSWSGPATRGCPVRGPLTSTSAPALAATTILMPCASWPAPGCMSCGAAGKTASPTTPPTTAALNASIRTARPQLDRLARWLVDAEGGGRVPTEGSGCSRLLPVDSGGRYRASYVCVLAPLRVSPDVAGRTRRRSSDPSPRRI
jgi:Transposase IS116/IS110/IS902 family